MGDPNRRYHDRIAGRYDDIYEGDPYWDYYFEVSWRDLKSSLPRDLALPVLDTGCGTGRYGLKLLKSGFRVVFSDLSPKMVDVAMRKAATLHPGRPCEGVVADITDLAPFTDASFSFVIGQGDPLSFSSDWLGALKNVRRVLCEKGRAVLSVDSRFGGLDPLLARGRFDELEKFLKDGESTWLARDESERFPLHAFTPEELCAGAESQGLSVIRIIGKTLLDLRGAHAWLQDRDLRERAIELEVALGASSGALGRAHHLQITLEKPKEGEGPLPPARDRQQEPSRAKRWRRR